MTRNRKDKHSTEFGLWLREQKSIDSRLGFIATNLDYIWSNYKTGEWMLIEEKRYGAEPTFTQSNLFKKLDKACQSQDNYHGFHVITFENTNPTDGKIKLDGVFITKEQLLQFLQFKVIEVLDE